MRPLLSLLDTSLSKFLTVGALNTLVGLLVIYAAKFFAGMEDISANLVGYGVGFLLPYALNSRWTFRYSGDDLPAALRFLLGVSTGYCVNLLAVLVLIQLFGVNSYVAQAMGIPPYTLTVYLLSKHFVFRQSRWDTLTDSGHS